MARQCDRPLSVAQAKERFRAAAEDALPSAYIRRHPYAALGLAFAAGLLAGEHPVSRKLVMKAMLRAL